MGGKCDNEEERPFPWVLGYKRRNDNKEVDITEFRVIKDHLIDFFLLLYIHLFIHFFLFLFSFLFWSVEVAHFGFKIKVAWNGSIVRPL